MDAWMIISVFILGTLCVSTLTGANPPILCTVNRCENNGTCITVSHPDVDYPSLCTSKTCYKIVLNNATWVDSLVECAKMDGNLVAFDNNEELEKVYRHFEDIFNFRESKPDGANLQFWTRGNNQADESNWVWALTGTPVSIQFQEPETSAEQNCLALTIPVHSHSKLQPQVCTESKPFICEIPKKYFIEERAFQCLCPIGYVGYRCEKHVEEACGENGCPNNETCFKRAGVPSFVCDCTTPGKMGHDCSQDADDVRYQRYQGSCFGSKCNMGVHTSRYYPLEYNRSRGYEELYLIYIPEARQIHFILDDIDLEEYGEEFKDHLFIGPGLVESDKETFQIMENNSFSVTGDMAWIYFEVSRPDQSQRRRGFRLRWFSYPEQQPLVISDDLPTTNLSCKEQTRIFIQYATVGQLSVDIHSNNVCLDAASLYKAAHRCNDLNTCKLDIERDFHTESCPIINRTLAIRYTCVKANDTNHTYGSVSMSPSTSSVTTIQNCHKNLSSMIHRKDIKPGSFDIRNCPHAKNGVASEQCTDLGEWSGEPDYSLCMASEQCSDQRGPTSESDSSPCTSQWINDIQREIENGFKSAYELALDIKNHTDDTDAVAEHVAANDLVSTITVLDDLVDLQTKQLQNKSEDERLDTVTKFNEAFLEIGSNLLDLSQSNIWVEVQDKGESPTKVTEDLEESAFLLASQLSDGSKTELKSENIIMAVVVPESAGDPVSIDFKYERQKNSITLPPPSANKSTTDKVQTVFLLYKTLGDLFGIIDEEIRFVEPGPTKETAKEAQNITTIINSPVISASVNMINEMERAFDEGNEVKFTLQHTKKNLTRGVTCVFWKYKNVSIPGWSSEGCRLIDTDDVKSTCACNHLTNFAILVDVQGTKISAGHELALKWITIIGCSISLICLASCVFAFTFFKSLHCIRTSIHRNLCISLLVAELIFLFGIDKTQNKVVCAVIAGTLHYSFLAAFFWMFLEALQFYIMLVLVFSSESKYWPYYATGYGLPLIIVGATAGMRYDGYGTDKYCWLSTEGNVIWSFAGPIAVIIAANLVLLFVSLYKAYSARSRVSKDATSTKNMGPWIKGALTMLFLLGCTWGVGLFFLSNESIVMAYLFTVLNSLQGLFIFVFYCLGNERVVTEIRKLIGRQMWLPPWFRERFGPPQKALTTTSNLDVKKKRAIPSVTVITDTGLDNPVMMQEETHNSWLYSEMGSKTIESDLDYESPYPEPDYE